ncbi:unnamed protein product [Rhizophagus irregularis]|nr:unnamed protein product [Rhizophagus irregularis]
MSLSLETSVSLEYSGPRETYGAFSSIYSAVWMEGPRWNLDEEAEIWTRTGPIKVILKRLDNSHNISQEFVDQSDLDIPLLSTIGEM